MLFWRGKAAAILYAAIIFTVTFIAGTADVFAAVDDHTVQGKTPQGTVISLFDYWVNEQSSPDHGTSNNNSSGGINKNHRRIQWMDRRQGSALRYARQDS